MKQSLLDKSSRMQLDLIDKDGNRLPSTYLSISKTEQDGIVQCQLLDKDGQPVGQGWTTEMSRLAQSLSAELNANYGQAVSIGNAQFLTESELNNSIVQSLFRQQTEQQHLDLNQVRLMARDTLLCLKETAPVGNERTYNLQDVQSLDISQRIDGKYKMTAVFNGQTVSQEVNSSTVERLKNASPEEKIQTLQAVFKNLNVNSADETVKDKLTKVIAQATQSVSNESVSRPEIYASKMESTVNTADALRAQAAASYQQKQEQDRGQSVSRSHGIGLG